MIKLELNCYSIIHVTLCNKIISNILSIHLCCKTTFFCKYQQSSFERTFQKKKKYFSLIKFFYVNIKYISANITMHATGADYTGTYYIYVPIPTCIMKNIVLVYYYFHFNLTALNSSFIYSSLKLHDGLSYFCAYLNHNCRTSQKHRNYLYLLCILSKFKNLCVL